MQTLFAALDNLENLLSQNDWLVGKRFTEVDIGLFTTLVHFDSVYYRHFKYNLRRLVDYLNHWNHTKHTISLALLLRLTLSILKTLLRQPQDHQSYKYRFCRTRFGLVSLKRDTEKFKT